MVGHSEGQAEVIRQDLLRVPGVKKINILRERPEQISSGSPYAKLATLGLSGQDIVALQRQNTVTPAGSIDTRGRRVNLPCPHWALSLPVIELVPIGATMPTRFSASG